MENIIGKIRSYYPVSDAGLDKLKMVLRPCTFKPKTLLLQAGRMNRTVYFIEKGLTRSYTVRDGKETTSWFSMDGELAFSSMTMYRDEPGFEYVQTLEPTVAYATSTLVLKRLFETDLDLANWWRVYMQETFLFLQDVHLARLKLSAGERYHLMLKQFPHIIQRAPLGHIASFLGITQSSLSRIRAGKE